MKNKRFCLCKYTIDDYHMMGEFLVKGFFATIKAFYDDEDGIEYNIHINKSNRELADNSIIVNTLARKAQAEILDAKPFKHKSKFRLKNTSRKPNSKKQVDESSTNEKLDKNQSFSDLIESSFLDDSNFISSLIGDYSQKLEENINKMIKESEEETKEGDYPTQNKMIKIMEEEDEYLDSDSNEDDSNSDPSEDNFSEGEINECFNKGKYLKEAKKIKLYQFSLTPQNLISSIKPKLQTINFESTPKPTYPTDVQTLLQISSINTIKAKRKSINNIKSRKHSFADYTPYTKVKEKLNISHRVINDKRIPLELPSLERIKDSFEIDKSESKRNYIFIDHSPNPEFKFEDIGMKGLNLKKSILDKRKLKASNVASFYQRSEILKRFINKEIE